MSLPVSVVSLLEGLAHIEEIHQGTDDWKQLRMGKVTASRICDVMAKLKSGGEAAGRANYRAQLMLERWTGKPQDSDFESEAMRRGAELEPDARTKYEVARDVLVEEVPFIDHPTIPMAGCSPDGLVGESGLVEIKCMNLAKHSKLWERLADGDNPQSIIPGDYQLQMLFQMACTGREWCDFVAYHPDLTGLELFCVRFPRDEERIRQIEQEVVKFNQEVEETLAKLRKLVEREEQ